MALVRQHTTPTEPGSASQNLPSDSSTTKPTKAESVPITKSKFWFDDGDVILQAANTQFRVHSFMLSRHSESVFEDVIRLAQAPSSEEKGEWAEECPLIYLDDRPSDLEYLMSILYDNIKDYPMETEIPLDHCAALIRLGDKYNIEYLREEGLRRFYIQFPCDITGWDKLCEDDHKPKLGIQRSELHEDFYEQALALAHDLSLRRALPAICLSLVMTKSSDKILKSIKSRSSDEKNKLPFPPYLLKQCLAARDKILCNLHKQIRYWIFVRASWPIPAIDCKSSFGCTPKRTEAIGALELGGTKFTHISIMETSGPFMRRIGHLQLCKECLVSVKGAVEKFRHDLWWDLPSIFRLGKTWEDLKDF